MSLKSILKEQEIESFVAFDPHLTHLVFKGNEDRLAGVFSWDRLNDSLNSLPLPSEAVRLFKEGNALNYSNALDLIAETMGGATLIFDDLDQYDAGLGRFADGVTGELGFPTRTNLYLSYPETQGFFAHYDTHAFLILQISGSKEWAIYEEREPSPLYYQKTHKKRNSGDLNLSEKVLLEEGDILFVPKGQWHDATAKDGSSVHLTLALFAPTGIDFFDWLADELRGDEDCRLDFPWGISPMARGNQAPDEELQESIDRAKSAIHRQFADKSLAARYLAHRAATMRVRNRLHYPNHISFKDKLEAGDSFYLAAKTMSYIRNDVGDSVAIVVGGLNFDVPCSFVSVLNFIAEHETFSYGELLTVPGGHTQDDLTEFLIALLKYGILAEG